MRATAYTFLHLLVLTLRRLRSRPGLTSLALLGIILAVGLLSSTAFFTQAVDRVILSQELDELSRVTGRIPFSTRIYFLPSSRAPVGLAEAENVGKSVAGTLSTEIGLPVEHLGVQVVSSGMMLLPQRGDTRYDQRNSFLGSITVGYVADIGKHVETLVGESFVDEGTSPPDFLDVWMHTRLAEEMGINVGEQFDIALNISQPRRAIRVAGLWQALEPAERFWFNNPDSNLKDVLIVRRDDYLNHVQPLLAAKSGLVAWHIILDDRYLNPAHARRYAQGFKLGMQVIQQYLPGARLDVSALDPLEDFVERQSTLTTILLGFNAPALGFLLAFLGLISAIIAEWQRRETAVLVSRGMGLMMILSLTLIESLLLFLVAVPVGLGFGMLLARVMGNTVSFLDFTQRAEFPISLQGASPVLIGAALGFSLLARVLPAAHAARQSVVVQAQERARPVRNPFWQRAYLDVLMILPTYYVYHQLERRGSLAKLVQEQPQELFQDPILILLPALFVLTYALLCMRFFPLLMRLFDQIAMRMPSLPIHLALRQLGRYTQSYMNPILLVIISLALGIYSYSLAASLDQWLVDRIYYAVGADVAFEPLREGEQVVSSSAVATGSPTGSAAWIPPKSEFAALTGVIKASRRGSYLAEIPGATDRSIRGSFLGIDREDFPDVAWYRSDFSPESLGAMMNRLALAPENVLVSESYLKQTGRRLGDQIRIEIRLEDGIRVRSEFTIAGVYTYFPTVYDETSTVIGNLEHLFFLGGAPYPHQILLKTLDERARTPDNSPRAREESSSLFKTIERMGFLAARRQDAGQLIAEEQAKFERVGIFGTLSVGFLAATLMAVIALLVYSNASLQERLYQFGVMRAIGLLRRQLILQIILEYGVLILYGAFVGLWIGAATSTLFVPFFRISGVQSAPLPPLIPVFARDQLLPLTLAFATIMVLVEAGLIIRTILSSGFDALRMGDHG